ncbi:putative protein kinase RLK-Pelle-CrRLK1L-1 family [Helianthus annuus]|nr:putative protein kinase RLK-Pelle-CrRLK1L-1 family [Helianthus annuus]
MNVLTTNHIPSMDVDDVELNGSYEISKGESSVADPGFLDNGVQKRKRKHKKTKKQSSALKTDAFNMKNLQSIYLSWHGFCSTTIPPELYMQNLVEIDMSYGGLEVFEPPMVLQSLKILNLNDSHYLIEIRNIVKIPNLEILNLRNCYNLVSVCENLGDLTKLALLNLTGCKNLYSLGHRKKPTFSLPFSLQQLILKDCRLASTDSIPFSSIVQPCLQYVNLGNSRFESLPCCDHLENLRILDLSFCSKLKCLVSLPSTLAELYIYYCESLERITFQSHRFTLQEFRYEGCNNLYEVEGFIKLVPIAKLDETDLYHMKWLKEYQNHQVPLVGDELTVGRNWQIQMLSEFGIMSTSLPDIKDPRLTPKYLSVSNSLFFDVPLCPKNKWLKGINVTFKYSISGDDCAWFCKISTTNGVVDWMYNPKVFGKPEVGEACIWLSYWPIGNKLNIGDTVGVSIVEISGLEVHECGVSLVYSDQEILDYNLGWAEILGGDLSRFQLSTGASYLCRRDFFELMEVGRLTSDWFRILVGDAVDYTEVRGWGKTGRPKPVIQSFTELKTVNISQMEQIESEGISKPFGSDESKVSNSPTHRERLKSVVTDELSCQDIKKITLQDIESMDYEENEGTLTSHARKIVDTNFSGVGPASELQINMTGYKASSSTSAHTCRSFSLAEIQAATKNFSAELVIGKGGFGTVYKGQISGEEAGHVVAIKRLDSISNQGELEFRAEIDTLSKLRHCHLVSLIGYCDDIKEKVLVYEYMPSGTLYHHLHKSHTPLCWVTRLKIAVGAARGMDYLHTGVGTRYGVIHRDVKSTNILLDANMAAMISDFGLSKIDPTNLSISCIDASVKGTFGYLDPDFFYTRKLTRKTDVYAFGVVLFELLSGRLAVDLDKEEEDQCSLVRWAKNCVKKRKLDQMVDPSIKGTISTKCLRGFAKMAARCVDNDPEKRPTMGELVTSLQALLKLQEKSNRSSQSSSKMGFPWRINQYFVSTTKPN